MCFKTEARKKSESFLLFFQSHVKTDTHEVFQSVQLFRSQLACKLLQIYSLFFAVGEGSLEIFQTDLLRLYFGWIRPCGNFDFSVVYRFTEMVFFAVLSFWDLGHASAAKTSGRIRRSGPKAG